MKKGFCDICGEYYSDCACPLYAFQDAHKKEATELQDLIDAIRKVCKHGRQPTSCSTCVTEKFWEEAQSDWNTAPSFNGRTSDCLSEGEGVTTYVVLRPWGEEAEVFCCCDSREKANYMVERLNIVTQTEAWGVVECKIF